MNNSRLQTKNTLDTIWRNMEIFFSVGAYFLLIKIFENKYKLNVGYISMFTFGLLRYPLGMILIIYCLFYIT